MGGTIQLTISLVMIALFTIAIISFVSHFGYDNNSNVKISDDSALVSLSNQVKDNLSNFDSGAQGTYSSIVETTVEPGSDVIQSSAPFAITPTNVFGIFRNILNVIYIKIFGSGSGFGIFLTTFLGLILFLMGLYIYKTLKGMPD